MQVTVTNKLCKSESPRADNQLAENDDYNNGSFYSQITYTLLPIVKLRIQRCPGHHHSLHLPHDSPRQVPKDRLDLVTRRMLVQSNLWDMSRRIVREVEAMVMTRAALDFSGLGHRDAIESMDRWMNKFVLMRMEAGSILIVIEAHSLSLLLLLLYTTAHP